MPESDIVVSESETAMPPAPYDIVKPDRLNLRVLTWGSLRIGTEWNAADVRSSYWRLYRNSSHGASLSLPVGSYTLTPGQFHFVPPWVHFSCRCRTELDHWYVHFDTIGLPGGVIRDIFSAPCALPQDEALNAALAALLDGQTYGHPLAFQLALKGLVHTALAKLMAQLPPPEADRCAMLAQGDHPVQAALSHIESHLRETLSNDLLAQLCHYSEDHFIRVFRQITGQSPAQYIIERRVAKAANLLLFSDASIEQVAERSGFPNRFYFSRVFSKRLGVSPAAYREATRV